MYVTGTACAVSRIHQAPCLPTLPVQKRIKQAKTYPCRNLRRENADLLKEKQKFDRAAEYVCQRVLKIIGTARREGNFNSQLVGELKRWNEKLEVRRLFYCIHFDLPIPIGTRLLTMAAKYFLLQKTLPYQ